MQKNYVKLWILSSVNNHSLYLLLNKSLAALPRSANDGTKDIRHSLYNNIYEIENQLTISFTIILHFMRETGGRQLKIRCIYQFNSHKVMQTTQ